jgi:hypothetical protein
VKPERRVLLRRNEDLPTRSNSPEETPSKVVKTPSLESVIKQVQDSFPSWKLDISPDNVVKLELYDDLHSLPKYTVLIHSSLEFTVAVYNWLIKEDHPIYKELKRSVMYHSMCELVNIIEESSLCQGLPDDIDVLLVVVDPTSKVTTSGTVLRHSIPKSITSEQTRPT